MMSLRLRFSVRICLEDQSLTDPTDELLDIHRFTLSNGIEVLYKQTDFKNDEIIMSAFSPGGHSLYEDDVYQSAIAIISVMRESGLSEFSAPSTQQTTYW